MCVTWAAGMVALEQGRGTVALGYSMGELWHGHGDVIGRLAGMGRRGYAVVLAWEQDGVAARA